MNVNCYGHDIEYYRTETEYNTPLRLLKEGRINKIRKEGSWGFCIWFGCCFTYNTSIAPLLYTT